MKRATKTGLLVGLVGVMTGIVWWQIPIEKRTYGLSQSAMTTDYTGLMPEKIAQINEVKKREELVAIVKERSVPLASQGFNIHKVAIRIIKMASSLICALLIVYYRWMNSKKQ